MNYYDMQQFVKNESRVNNFEGLDSLIEQTLNRVYREYARKQNWRELIVYGEEFDTALDTYSYVAPYALSNLQPGTFLYDYNSDIGTGQSLNVIMDPSSVQRYARFAEGVRPYGAVIRGNVGSDLYATGSATVANESTGVTGTGTTWTSAAHAGKWMRFGYSATSTASGGNYGYKIASVTNTTTLVLEEAYRGAALTQAKYAIRPATGPMIVMTPQFTEYGKTIRYAWQRVPRRLYNPDDTPEVEKLSEILVSDTCATVDSYHMDAKRFGLFKERARQQYKEILQDLAF